MTPETRADHMIARGDTFSGRRYATRLATTVQRLDAAFGKSLIRQLTPARRRIRDTKAAIRLIRKAHPEWAPNEIGMVLGLHPRTIARYLQAIGPTPSCSASP